jgi:endonuclease/exonuclease/phosphatase (EEP) superfamily protein YafD
MFKPRVREAHQCLEHQSETAAQTLNVVCWNVAKISHTPECALFLERWLEPQASNLVLFQEARFVPAPPKRYCDLSWILSPNIETRQHHFGVQTLFDWRCERSAALISQRQELWLATHKSALITTHALNDGRSLICVNVHAINFVPNPVFYAEMDRILALVDHHSGPIVIAGDFNTWNQARVRFIETRMQQAGLNQVECREPHYIKRFGRHRLDHLFYRGLILEDAWVVNTARVSDHNPLIAQFNVSAPA